MVAAIHDFVKPLGATQFTLVAANMGPTYWPLFGFLPSEDQWYDIALTLKKIIKNLRPGLQDEQALSRLAEMLNPIDVKTIRDFLKSPWEIRGKKAAHYLWNRLKDDEGRYRACLEFDDEESYGLLLERIKPYQNFFIVPQAEKHSFAIA